MCSVPRYCGKLKIKYPFFMQEQTEPRCSYPGIDYSRENTKEQKQEYRSPQIQANIFIEELKRMEKCSCPRLCIVKSHLKLAADAKLI
ncbi:hypothetical protein V6N11_054113 [Hibiscus sabdariffa]|uniref:Uncharacterized protein n=1 Tax=Hibiscus sabdariffa TaxID=183260 RepID=A0ABR2S3V6_9ROSI